MIKIVETSVERALKKETKLNEKAFNIQGMSSPKVRIFLNSVIELLEKPKYLEIGVWKGSTLYSALYKNNVSYAAAIDNWALFGGPRQEFLNNMSDVGTDFEFYDEDCFKIEKSKFKDKFNIFFYDGEHEVIDQEMALTYYYDCLEDNFLYICDDWNFPKVPVGTKSGIEKCNLKIQKEWILHSKFNGDTENWWNGLYVAILSKK